MADRKATAFTEAVILVTDFIPFIKVGDSGNFRDEVADILDLYNARIATLSNKTLDLADNTVTGTKALFDTALSDDNFAYLGAIQTFTSTITLNSFKGTGAVTVTDILDEDNQVSDSATALVTQQSIKKYVDDNVTGLPVPDTQTIIEGSVDATKLLRFEIDGFTTGTTRVITPPDKDITLVGTVDNLSVFAATTSLQLLGVISDETGSGLLVFGTSPTIVTPTIASFANATHDHSNAAGGGNLTNSALTSGVFSNITGLGAQSQTLDMNTQILQFVDANQTITNSGGNLLYDIATGQVHLWRVNNVTEMQLSATALAMQGNSILLGGSNIDNIRNLIHDQSVSGTDIDFNEDEQQTISIAVNTTFTTANRAIGKSKTLKIVTDATLRTLTFPAWVFVGAKPADQAASKTGILTVTCFGTADTDIVAAYAVEE